MTVEWLDVPGGRLAYRQWQPAHPRATLMLLHGFGGDSLAFAALGPMLAERGWRVVAPDMPAHGVSECPASSLADLLAPLAVMLAQIAPGPVSLAGHSLGGAMAARLAAASDRVTSLTLLAPAGLGPVTDTSLPRLIATIATGEQLRGLLERVALRPPAIPLPQLDELAKFLGPRGRLKDLAEVLAEGGDRGLSIVADLAGLAIPVRVLFGLDDTVIPWTQVSAVPPRIAIHLLPSAGHALHWDQAELVAALIA